MTFSWFCYLCPWFLPSCNTSQVQEDTRSSCLIELSKKNQIKHCLFNKIKVEKMFIFQVTLYSKWPESQTYNLMETINREDRWSLTWSSDTCVKFWQFPFLSLCCIFPKVFFVEKPWLKIISFQILKTTGKTPTFLLRIFNFVNLTCQAVHWG